MASLDDRITTFSRDGLRFDGWTDEGPLDGDVVVLLHGFPTDRTSWDRVAARLHEAGLRTLAPDQRGYSPGARPTDEDEDYRLRAAVGDVLALIEASGRERVHLVGHDWGGALAWLVAANHPTRIASLTVLSTPHPAAMSRAWRSGIDQKRRSWYMAAFQVPWVPEHVSWPPGSTRSWRAPGCRRRTGGGCRPPRPRRCARGAGQLVPRSPALGCRGAPRRGAHDLRVGRARPVPRSHRRRADP